MHKCHSFLENGTVPKMGQSLKWDKHPSFTFVCFYSDTLDCLERGVAFSPPLWSMCSDCVASLLLMVNFSGNFLIYCSALKSFRGKLKQIWQTSSQKTNGTRRQSRVSVKISEIQSTPTKLLNILVPLHRDARARPLFVGTDLGLGHRPRQTYSPRQQLTVTRIRSRFRPELSHRGTQQSHYYKSN